MASPVSTTVNPDLAEERRNLPFDVRKFAEFIHGKSFHENQKLINDWIESEPGLKDSRDIDFMSREERIENAWRKAILTLKSRKRLGLESDPGKHQLVDRHLFNFDKPPYALHYIMFLPTILNQADEAQQAKWLPMAQSLGMMGSYSQTELGHGTNLRNLETTATYDPASQEFVVHSPTITSTKWWPGNLGKVSNYTIVQAQLWSLGKCHGPHLFLVQLRNLDTHKPLAGITVGDIGPKMAYEANENGFLRLDKVRIPRDHMLMRHAKVLPDGSYINPPHEKIGYGGMLFVRAAMIHGLALSLAKTCTIATRYSCVRRQGEIAPGAGEVKLLDYQTQQYKLFPYIASAFAFHFAGVYIWDVYSEISKQIKHGDVEQLPELHALAAGMKAQVSWESVRGMEICRLACGGHGYSLASRLPQYYSNNTPSCTFEGDNTVMLLQVARYLVKAKRAPAQSGARSAYLHGDMQARSRLDSAVRMDDLVEAYKHVAQRLNTDCVAVLDQLALRGMAAHDAWNMTTIQLTHAAKAHVNKFFVENFHVNVLKIQDPTIRGPLEKLCLLYTMFGIYKRPGKFLEDGYLSQHQLELVRERLHQLLAEIRPIAVGLVDAFGFTDRELNDSILGRYDGNVYEHLYQWAAGSPLNQNQVLDSYHKYLGPAMKEARSKL